MELKVVSSEGWDCRKQANGQLSVLSAFRSIRVRRTYGSKFWCCRDTNACGPRGGQYIKDAEKIEMTSAKENFLSHYDRLKLTRKLTVDENH